MKNFVVILGKQNTPGFQVVGPFEDWNAARDWAVEYATERAHWGTPKEIVELGVPKVVYPACGWLREKSASRPRRSRMKGVGVATPGG